MIIFLRDLTTLGFIDTFDLSGLPGIDQIGDTSYGISADVENIYATDFTTSMIIRADIATLVGDLVDGSYGSNPDEFIEPTYSTIVTPVTPAASSPFIFGNIIW